MPNVYPKKVLPKSYDMWKKRKAKISKSKTDHAKILALQRQMKKMKRTNPKPEKKFITTYADEEFLGQVDAQADGFIAADTTPNPAQGIGIDQRIGAEVTLTGLRYDFQIRQMSANIGNAKISIELFKVPAQVWSSAATFTNTIFEANPFIRTSGGANAGVIDFNSNFDPNYFGQWKLIRRKVITLKGDSLANQVNIKTFPFGIKFKKGLKIKWNDNGVTPQYHQLILVIRADTGNMSTTTASTNTGIANTAVNTGFVVNYSHKTYYIDN